MNVTKSRMTVNGDTVRVSMPFAKVDKKNRLVSGFATLDNIDTEGDEVSAEASAKAFARARGNIREMHDKIAVGRLVKFSEDEYFDQDSGQTFRGMYVTAYVSEGAPNTWLKVLDGTLSGFSIGGKIVDFENKINKGTGQSVRLIKDYDLEELSLVDNPANQLANFDSIEKATVISFEKSAGSVKVSGMVVDTVLENVFFCKHDDTIIVKSQDTMDCPDCGNQMEVGGYFEDGEHRQEKIANIVNKFMGQEASPSNEGGVEMAKSETPVPEAKETNIVNPGEEHSDGTKVDDAAETKPAAVDVEETDSEKDEATAPDEVEDESTEISKKIDELRETISKTLQRTEEVTSERMQAVEQRVEKATSEFLAEAKALREEMSEVAENLRVTKNRISELENGLQKMNSSVTLKKSAELEDDDAAPLQKNSTWEGSAFSVGRKGFKVNSLL